MTAESQAWYVIVDPGHDTNRDYDPPVGSRLPVISRSMGGAVVWVRWRGKAHAYRSNQVKDVPRG